MSQNLDGTPASFALIGLSLNIVCGVDYVNELTNILENFNLKLNRFQYGSLMFD